MSAAIQLMEKGLMPDALIRWGIRRLLAQRLRQEDHGSREAQSVALNEFVEMIRKSPVAVATDEANEQHYELPPAFFERALGARLKYSSCYWPEGVDTLDAAEERMLDLTCFRADLKDGHDILELGCGWGSLTLWMAEHYPKSRITAVSNSAPQRAFILARAKERHLDNVEVITADMNEFTIDRWFNRVISLEMFEHMRNWEELLHRIHGWLVPDGKLFIHVFCHREFAYLFQTEGETDWMGRYFFTGGMMPSEYLFDRFQRDLVLEKQWAVNGRHYEKTLLAWLAKQDAARDELMPVMEEVYGKEDAAVWFQRWRIFFLACAELFGYRNGEEWYVGHYLFSQRSSS